MKAHALCLVLSSCTTESLPRCFAERDSTCPGVKYGLWNLDEEGGVEYIGEDGRNPDMVVTVRALSALKVVTRAADRRSFAGLLLASVSFCSCCRLL